MASKAPLECARSLSNMPAALCGVAMTVSKPRTLEPTEHCQAGVHRLRGRHPIPGNPVAMKVDEAPHDDGRYTCRARPAKAGMLAAGWRR